MPKLQRERSYSINLPLDLVKALRWNKGDMLLCNIGKDNNSLIIFSPKKINELED